MAELLVDARMTITANDDGTYTSKFIDGSDETNMMEETGTLDDASYHHVKALTSMMVTLCGQFTSPQDCAQIFADFLYHAISAGDFVGFGIPEDGEKDSENVH